MSKFVTVHLSNDQYEEDLEIPGQTNYYYYNVPHFDSSIIDKMIAKIRGLGDDGENYYKEGDEIEFEAFYTTENTISGQVSVNGDVHWDMEMHLVEFEK